MSEYQSIRLKNGFKAITKDGKEISHLVWSGFEPEEVSNLLTQETGLETAQLRSELEAAQAKIADLKAELETCTVTFKGALKQGKELQAETARLKAALKPFAELAKADDAKRNLQHNIPNLYYSSELAAEGSDEPIVYFTWGDVTRAAVLLYNPAHEAETDE